MTEKYSGIKGAEFSVILYRYTLLLKLLGQSKPADSISPKVGFSDEELEYIRRSHYSEQKERLLFLCSDGVISKNAFEVFFNSPADILDILIELETDYINRLRNTNDDTDDDEADISVYENALAAAVFVREHTDIFTDINFSDALELVSSAYVEKIDIDPRRDECIGILFHPLLKRMLLKSGFPVVGNGQDNKFHILSTDEVQSELEKLENAAEREHNEDESDETISGNKYDADSSLVFSANMSRTLFVIKHMRRKYGLEFIREAVKEHWYLMKEETVKSKYEEFIGKRNFVFSVNAYRRLRNYCREDVYNIVDYRHTDEIDRKKGILKTSLKKDDALSAERIQLDPENIPSKNDFEFPGQREITNALFAEYRRRITVLPEGTVIETGGSDELRMYVFRRTADNKTEFMPLDREDFLKPVFDFNEVWKYIMKQQDKNNITKHNGEIVFRSEPEDISPLFRGYVLNVYKEVFCRNESEQKDNSIESQLMSMDAFLTETHKHSEKKKIEDGGGLPPSGGKSGGNGRNQKI